MTTQLKLSEQAQKDYHIIEAKSWTREMGTPVYAFKFRDFEKLTQFMALLKELGLRTDGINYMTVYAK